MSARHRTIILAHSSRPVVADFLEIVFPVRAVYSVDALRLELHKRIVEGTFEVGEIRRESRCQLDDFVKALCVELRLKVCQSIVHLCSALRVAQIEDFFLPCCFFDRSDVCSVIIEAHFRPSPVPILRVCRSVESLVAPTVHRSTIVSDPNIVASINEQQMG